MEGPLFMVVLAVAALILGGVGFALVMVLLRGFSVGKGQSQAH